MTRNPFLAESVARFGYPAVVEAEDLAQALPTLPTHVRLLDLSAREGSAVTQIPGAIAVDFSSLVREAPPVSGLLPTDAELAPALRRLDLTEDAWVIAFDEGNGLKATRLLWTLWVRGFRRLSLLNGGLGAWAQSGCVASPVAPRLPRPASAQTAFQFTAASIGVMEAEDILAALDRPGFVCVDCRSDAEYRGEDLRSARGGHIPGSIHLDWRELLRTDGRLLAEPELRARVEAAGLHPDQELVTYCQTHRRSCVVWWALVALGFPRVSGYPGSWSDWGNRTDTPIESAVTP